MCLVGGGVSDGCRIGQVEIRNNRCLPTSKRGASFSSSFFFQPTTTMTMEWEWRRERERRFFLLSVCLSVCLLFPPNCITPKLEIGQEKTFNSLSFPQLLIDYSWTSNELEGKGMAIKARHTVETLLDNRQWATGVEWNAINKGTGWLHERT